MDCRKGTNKEHMQALMNYFQDLASRHPLIKGSFLLSNTTKKGLQLFQEAMQSEGRPLDLVVIKIEINVFSLFDLQQWTTLKKLFIGRPVRLMLLSRYIPN